MVTNLIKTKYSTGKFSECVIPKCRQGCRLKDIPSSYLILDGDRIEKCNGRIEALSSCDCIILKNNYHNKVLLTELRTGHIDLKKAKKKFQNSGEEIMNAIHDHGYDFPSVYLVVLGRIEDSGKKSKDRDLWINGKYCQIKVFNCGSSFNDMQHFIKKYGV
jgi:hypothetical protein